MSTVETISVLLFNNAGGQTRATLQARHWTKADARSRALKWGGAIVAICLCMLPIPLVHFAIIPVFFVALPVTLFAVNKLYSKGTDISGTATCPSCSQPVQLQRAADDWPLDGRCPRCNKSYQIKPESGSSGPAPA